VNPQPEVIDIIAEHIGKNPHVERVILFGSRARGDERERSNIDLAAMGADI
jgi:predicted nucleotidyltransferase